MATYEIDGRYRFPRSVHVRSPQIACSEWVESPRTDPHPKYIGIGDNFVTHIRENGDVGRGIRSSSEDYRAVGHGEMNSAAGMQAESVMVWDTIFLGASLEELDTDGDAVDDA